jgi:integrase
VLRKLAEAGLSHESVSKVRFAMGDMVKRMVAEEYLTSNIASGLKTPKAARRSDRSRLRRVTLREYLQAWTVLEERERLAFDLVTFCGMRESEAYGLRNGDLFQRGAIRVERSWYRGEINPTKTNEIREVGVGLEIFERLMAWVATLPDGSTAGWVFAAGQRPAPMRASTLGGVGTGLDQFCSVAALAFNAARGSRHESQNYRGPTGSRSGCTPFGIRGLVDRPETGSRHGVVAGFQSSRIRGNGG